MAEFDQDVEAGESVGERLRIAREQKGMSLEDVARISRIPIRHLEHIERGEWEALPAITYSVGFVRSYANLVDLDGPALGAEVREQLGGGRAGMAGPASYYEPADPARVPPRTLAITVAVIAILLVGGYLLWRNSAIEDPSAGQTEIVDASPAPAGAPPAAVPQAAPTPAAAANGPVVLSATEDVWLRVYEADGGPALYQGILKAGESYQVPAGARAPQIRTGRANALRVTVGGAAVPPLGPPEKTIADVSLRPADLLARTQPAGQPAAAPPQPAAPPPGD